MSGNSDQAWHRLQLRHLLALEAVARSGSFRAAAGPLGYSQSAISDQIAALERIVGSSVLDRSRGGGSVVATEAGRILLAHLTTISGGIESARADLRALEEGRRTVRLGIYASVARHLLAGIARDLAETSPETELRVEEASDDGELLGRLSLGELDLTFASLPLASGPFAFREVVADRYLLLVQAGSPLVGLAEGGALPLAALAELPLIDYRGLRSIHHTLTRLPRSIAPPRVVFRSDDNGTIHALVAAGLGVAVLPELSIDRGFAGLRILALDPPVPARRHAIVWNRERDRSPAAIRIIELASRLAAGVATSWSRSGDRGPDAGAPSA